MTFSKSKKQESNSPLGEVNLLQLYKYLPFNRLHRKYNLKHFTQSRKVAQDSARKANDFFSKFLRGEPWEALRLCVRQCFFLQLSAKALATAGCLFLSGSISAFPSPLTDFDNRPEWPALFNKDRFLAHLIETGSPASSSIHRSWLENELAPLLRQPLFLSSLRQCLLQGDSDLYETMLDSLLSLNLPSDYARTHLMEWILGSENSLRSPLLQFPTAPAIRTRFATYLLHHPRSSDLTAQLILKACETQDPYLERLLRKNTNSGESIDWTLLKRYPQLSPQAQLEFRYLLFRAYSRKRNSVHSLPSHEKKEPPFASLVWDHLLKKINLSPTLLNDYQAGIAQRTEPEQWTREALTEALRQNESDSWFQSYLQAAQIPHSRYQAVFMALTQNRAEKKARPELIAESSQERTPWRARLVQLIQNDPRWSAYFLWHLTRAAEPITLQWRRSLPALFAQRETITLEWLRWTPQAPNSLSSAQLKDWGIRWGETLRNQDQEWKKLWSHHDLITQSLLQKTLVASLESNPTLVTTWVAILQEHQPSLQNSFALWTQQNTPHPDLIHLPVFMNRLSASIQRKEWVGNLDLALFRVAFSNFLRSQEGWNQLSWRIGLESYQIAQPLRELLLQHWSQHPEKFWKLLSWRTVYCPNPQAEQKRLFWIRSHKISEKSLLALSKQNPEIQTATDCLWLDLFQSNLSFQNALKSKRATPAQQDDLDQLLTSIPPLESSSLKTSVTTLLLRGGDSALADWILRRADLQKIWITQFETKLLQEPLFLQQITESLLKEKRLSPDSLSELITLLLEDRHLFEALLSDPTLGFKSATSTPHGPSD